MTKNESRTPFFGVIGRTPDESKRVSAKITEVSKKCFLLTNMYRVQTEPGTDEILIFSTTEAVDQLNHDIKLWREGKSHASEKAS